MNTFVRHCERSAAIHEFKLHGLPRRFAPRNDNNLIKTP
jgi:hypothetical protein